MFKNLRGFGRVFAGDINALGLAALVFFYNNEPVFFYVKMLSKMCSNIYGKSF